MKNNKLNISKKTLANLNNKAVNNDFQAFVTIITQPSNSLISIFFINNNHQSNSTPSKAMKNNKLKYLEKNGANLNNKAVNNDFQAFVTIITQPPTRL